MIKLTDLGGNPIYFNPEAIEIVRNVARNKAAANARTEIIVSFCADFVQESVDDVIKKLG